MRSSEARQNTAANQQCCSAQSHRSARVPLWISLAHALYLLHTACFLPYVAHTMHTL